jgi:hypothetical protein
VHFLHLIDLRYALGQDAATQRLMAGIIQRLHCPDRPHHLIKRTARLPSAGVSQHSLEVSRPAKLLKFKQRPDSRPGTARLEACGSQGMQVSRRLRTAL